MDRGGEVRRPQGRPGRLRGQASALHQQLATQTFTALDLANGAKSLLNEVAAKKVTGEEDQQFAAVGALLARHRDAGGRYAAYTTLTPAQVRELSDAITAPAEPISRVGAAISAR
jgi:iron uptake system component EfeO